jgi:RHS repeat-associated protein
MEMEGSVGVPPANTVLRKYTWGLDLAGLNGQLNSRDGAGGVGGLLAMQAPGAGPGGGNLDYVYMYDGNGNVGQLVDLSHDPNDPAGAVVAHYEYDPYGNLTAHTGPYAEQNPFRFSTKYWDAETGLGYWGFRYYNAALGRWLNRDPIEELGGANLYTYGGNEPVGRFDALGLLNCRRGEPCIFAHDDDYEGGGRCPKKGQSQWDPQPGESMGPQPWEGFQARRLGCSEYCKSDAVKSLLSEQGNPEGLVVCSPNGPCACTNPNLPAGTPGNKAARDCVQAHEENHIETGASCFFCFRPPCAAGRGWGNLFAECFAYETQLQCLAGKLEDSQCDKGCKDEVRKEIDMVQQYVATLPACKLLYWQPKTIHHSLILASNLR